MDDVGGVRLGQAPADLGDDRDGGLDVQPPDLGHPLVERLALEQLEDQEGAPVVQPTGVVDVADVGAADGRCGPGLPEEALDDDRGGGQLLREDLDRDALADVDVRRLVHGGHAAAAKLAGDACTCPPGRFLPGSSSCSAGPSDAARGEPMRAHARRQQRRSRRALEGTEQRETRGIRADPEAHRRGGRPVGRCAPASGGAPRRAGGRAGGKKSPRRGPETFRKPSKPYTTSPGDAEPPLEEGA